MDRATRAGLAGTVLGALLAAPLWGADVPASMHETRVPGYRSLTPSVAAAGQPTLEGLAELKAAGFKTVVSLRRPEEPGQEGEEESAKTLGLRFVRVPVTPATLSLEDVEAVERVLEDASAGLVLLHCASANRVGGVWGVIEARKGKTLEEAEAEGRKAGATSPSIIEAFRRLATEAKR
jgi:uncharacterized protein (TIGR01244 family)